jgi:hypothetical protein
VRKERGGVVEIPIESTNVSDHIACSFTACTARIPKKSKKNCLARKIEEQGAQYSIAGFDFLAVK